jgi:hypothetical protein
VANGGNWINADSNYRDRVALKGSQWCKSLRCIGSAILIGTGDYAATPCAQVADIWNRSDLKMELNTALIAPADGPVEESG